VIERTEAEIRELDAVTFEKARLYWKRESERVKHGVEAERDPAQRQFLMMEAEAERRGLVFET